MCYAKVMMIKIKNRKAITFTEIMMATVMLVVLLLPLFNFLTKSMKDTEKIHVECVALTHARQIMDTMMYQIPFRDIRVDQVANRNFCYFETPPSSDPKLQDQLNRESTFLNTIIPEIFGKENDEYKEGNRLIGNGLIKTDKGFLVRTRAKVEEIDREGNEQLLSIKGITNGDVFKFRNLTSRNADNNFSLVKKIVVQVKWSLIKGKDPNDDRNAKTMFLVGFKSDIEG